jgi:hypothetical protein
MMESKAASWCLSDLLTYEVQRIELQRLWKAMVMYWLPLQARMGSLPVSLVYSLASGKSMM